MSGGAEQFSNGITIISLYLNPLPKLAASKPPIDHSIVQITVRDLTSSFLVTIFLLRSRQREVRYYCPVLLPEVNRQLELTGVVALGAS